MQQANNSSNPPLDGVKPDQQDDGSRMPDTDQACNAPLDDPLFGLTAPNHDIPELLEPSNGSAQQAAHDSSWAQQETLQNNQIFQGSGLGGLPRYHPSQALTASPQPFTWNSEQSYSRPVPTNSTDVSAQPFRPSLQHQYSAPATYSDGGGGDIGLHLPSHHAPRHHHSVPQFTGGGVLSTEGPSTNTSPADQPAVHAPSSQVEPEPSRANRDLHDWYMRQRRAGLTPPFTPQEPGPGIDKPVSFGRTKTASKRPIKPKPSGAGRLREKFQCFDCLNLGRENWYCHTESTGSMYGEERCRKHHAKWLKEQASTEPPVYRFNIEIPSFEEAKIQVYPTIRPLLYEGDGADDYVIFKDAEDDWIENFINAANTEYSDETAEYKPPRNHDKQREHEHLLKQQETYNHKPHEKSSKESYTNDFINIRMRFLFRAVLTYHQGGPAIYPVGGANGGYGEDTTLSMSERLKQIEEILTKEKRVVMDVIEGRGVLALAANPKHYMDRKQSNNKCNTKKKGKFAIADAVKAGYGPTPGNDVPEDGGFGQSERYATPTPKPLGGKGKRKARVQGQRAAGSKRQTRASGSMLSIAQTPGMEQHQEELRFQPANAIYSGGESSVPAPGDFALTGCRPSNEHQGRKDTGPDTSGLHQPHGNDANGITVPDPVWQEGGSISTSTASGHAAGMLGGLPPQTTQETTWQLPENTIDPEILKHDTTGVFNAGEDQFQENTLNQGEEWDFFGGSST